MGTHILPADKILLLTFVALAMMSITLQTTLRQIIGVLRNKALLTRALLVNLVLVPALGIVLIRLFSVPDDVKNGILLLALAPGDFLAMNFTRKLCARIELAAALLFLLILCGIVLTPILASWILPSQLSVTLSYARVAKVIFLYVVLPLTAGLALNASVPNIAAALQKPIGILSGAAFIGFTIATASMKSSAAKAIAGSGSLLALALLAIGGMVFGWVCAGTDPETRRVLAVSSSLRNLALPLAIASRGFPNRNVELTILAFAFLAIPMSLLFTMYQKRKIKELEKLPTQQKVRAA